MIAAIGNPVYDFIKTPKCEPNGRVLSGCSTNAALALAKIGEQVRLIGAVGDDYREHFKASLEKLGIEHEIVPSRESGGFSLIYYDDFGNRTLNLIGRADNIGRINPALYADCSAILVGPILGELSFEEIVNIRKNFSGLYFCDPQGLLRGAHENGDIYHEKTKGIEDVLGHFDIVKPNELEGKILTGIDCRQDPYEAARIIKSWGPRIVIVTLAELGSVIYDGREYIDIPPYGIDLVDSTGAGDTYMAGFTFEYLKTGGDLRRAGCYASCTSSVMIENTGPDFSMSDAMIRERQEKLLAISDYRVRVGVNQ
ncbi:MAG: PfkB family carbohydrate kinase [candidate division Zixibacteria bacterium]|nr:PfkB family carbohydrate kinase [candidate division Zixibacteria bacterium]